MLSMSLLTKQDNTIFASEAQTLKNEIKTYADAQDFINLRPILGVDGETEYHVSIAGLRATIPSKLLFLGGYCSTMPETVVSFVPNQTNFVYLIRNRDDRHKIDISIRDKAIGVETENAFNRILLGKFTTNANSVTSYRYFPV